MGRFGESSFGFYHCPTAAPLRVASNSLWLEPTACADGEVAPTVGNLATAYSPQQAVVPQPSQRRYLVEVLGHSKRYKKAPGEKPQGQWVTHTPMVPPVCSVHLVGRSEAVGFPDSVPGMMK